MSEIIYVIGEDYQRCRVRESVDDIQRQLTVYADFLNAIVIRASSLITIEDN